MSTNLLSAHLQNATPHTLFALLSRYRVSVPGIQRHYVQGGSDAHATEVRTIFINDIFQSFRKGNEMSLDFIFGPLDTKGADTFVPVDGQQRLTTLWLVARYAVAKLPPEAASTRTEILRLLSRFQYADRRYASRFCAALCDEGVTNDAWATGTPSVELAKAGIVNPGWQADSTVAAMLNTFDTIHELWPQGISAEDFLVYLWEKVTFRLCMEHFADDLYMKMNARGLTLTQWEQVKGKIANMMKEVDWSNRIEMLSERYFNKMDNSLPDTAFFALLGRISNYALGEEAGSELRKLAEWKSNDELPYVPFEQFKLSGTQVDTLLSMMEYLLANADLLSLPNWADVALLKAVFLPQNAEQRELSLMLFDYFDKFKTKQPVIYDVNHFLRIAWNVLNNVTATVAKDRQRRLAAVKGAIQAASYADLYLDADLHFDGDAVQYREEEAKGKVYRAEPEADGVTVDELQKAEEFLHGRVRMALLDLANSNAVAICKTRFEAILAINWAWQQKGNRKSLIIKVMMAMPYWADADTFFLADDKPETMRNLLATPNDGKLQHSLLDYIAGRNYDIAKISGEEMLANNPFGWDSRPDCQKGQAWRRDWQRNLLWLSEKMPDEISGTKMVKYHGASDNFYLYFNSTIHSALPLNDYRFDYRRDSTSKKLWEEFCVEIKDANKGDIRVTEGAWTGKYEVAADKSSINVYFVADKAIVSKFMKEKPRVDIPVPWCAGVDFFNQIREKIKELATS